MLTELPGPHRLFERHSEAQLFESIRQDARRRPGAAKVIFPDEPLFTKATYLPRQFPRMVEVVEPHFVVHRRLYFEQQNFERHGWELGVMQPAVGLAMFYKDLVLFPYHFWARPCQRYDTSAGKCLPGDPVPLYLYPPELSVTGLLGQAGAIAGGIAIFP